MQGLWQGIASNFVWWLILIFGGAAIAFLKLYHPDWAGALVLGLAALACLGILHFSVTGRSLLSRELPKIDANNVEEHIKTWIAAIGLASQSVPIPDTAFAQRVTLQNGNSIIVSRNPKNRPSYIHFLCGMTLSPEHAIALEKMNDAQAVMVWHEVSLELARSKMGYSMNGKDARHMQTIGVQTLESIPSLSDSIFATALDEIDSAALIVKASLTLSFSDLHQGAQQLQA